MLLRLRTIAILSMALMALPLASKAQSCAAFIDFSAQGSKQAMGSTPAASASAHGLDLADLDRSVSPCRDFFQFADGGWIRSHSIPPGDDTWGLIDQLQQQNRDILRQILESEAAAHAQAEPGSGDQKLGDFYASCMNTREIDALRSKPLAPELFRIARIRNLGEFETELARLQEMGADALFSFGATPDITDSAEDIARIDESGLGLPDRDIYLQDDAYDAGILQKYRMHIARMFELLGASPGEARVEARAVLRIETLLATGWLSRAERSDPEATFHKMNIEQLQALTPHFSWARYFRALGSPSIGAIDVSEPGFLQTIDHGLASIPLADWKIYLRWQLIHAFAPDLSGPFVAENFDFYGRTLAGDQQIQPRWQSCVVAASRELPELLGPEYIARAFPPSARAAALAMVHNLIGAIREDLQTNYWMSPSARAAAVAKLDKLNIQVGYSNRASDDSTYRVTTGPFVENVINGNDFHFHRDLARIGSPADRSRWLIPASASDAFYDPTANAIFLPAGIFQPPFFDPQADDALNYGGIGTVIGHELTHGFDNEGSRFDADGNLKDWWTPDDQEYFRSLGQCVADQYDTYVAVGDLHENGHLVLGESIADIGGLTIAYQAFENAPESRSRLRIQGFTPAQRFFLAYARMWTEIRDPQSARLSAHSDPHAIGRFRVIGPLSDFEPFSEAFLCRDKDSMVRPEPDRCAIW